jgi:hypothetical protein
MANRNPTTVESADPAVALGCGLDCLDEALEAGGGFEELGFEGLAGPALFLG